MHEYARYQSSRVKNEFTLLLLSGCFAIIDIEFINQCHLTCTRYVEGGGQPEFDITIDIITVRSE